MCAFRLMSQCLFYTQTLHITVCRFWHPTLSHIAPALFQQNLSEAVLIPLRTNLTSHSLQNFQSRNCVLFRAKEPYFRKEQIITLVRWQEISKLLGFLQ